MSLTVSIKKDPFVVQYFFNWVTVVIPISIDLQVDVWPVALVTILVISFVQVRLFIDYDRYWVRYPITTDMAVLTFKPLWSHIEKR